MLALSFRDKTAHEISNIRVNINDKPVDTQADSTCDRLSWLPISYWSLTVNIYIAYRTVSYYRFQMLVGLDLCVARLRLYEAAQCNLKHPPSFIRSGNFHAPWNEPQSVAVGRGGEGGWGCCGWFYVVIVGGALVL